MSTTNPAALDELASRLASHVSLEREASVMARNERIRALVDREAALLGAPVRDELVRRVDALLNGPPVLTRDELVGLLRANDSGGDVVQALTERFAITDEELAMRVTLEVPETLLDDLDSWANAPSRPSIARCEIGVDAAKRLLAYWRP